MIYIAILDDAGKVTWASDSFVWLGVQRSTPLTKFPCPEADRRAAHYAAGVAFLGGAVQTTVVTLGRSKTRFELRFERVNQSLVLTALPVAQDALSSTETKVAHLIVRDWKAGDICKELDITMSTFQTHRGHILKKLDVTGTAGITQWLAEHQPTEFAAMFQRR